MAYRRSPFIALMSDLVYNTNMKNFLMSLFVLCAFPYLVSSAYAQNTVVYQGEYIHSFDALMQIQKSGEVKVTETIVYDFGSEDRHGIYRTIKTDRTNDEGKVLRIDTRSITVEDANGELYKFATSRIGDSIELKIGDPDKTISGVHTYVIQYTLAGAMTYFEGADELYWNITGTEWDVPIANVTISVEVPQEISEGELQYTCFVGGAASEDTSRCAVAVSGYRVSYSTENLLPGEGMTPVLRFPMGYIEVLEPQPVVNFFDTFWGQLTLFGIMGGLVWWYILYPLSLPIRWWIHGRDPEHQGIGVTQAWFEGPKLESGRTLTPAETGAVIDEKIQIEEYSALIVSLAQQGYLTIVEKKKKDFELHRTDKPIEKDQLLPFEYDFMSSLFSEKSVIRMKDEGVKLAKLVEVVEKNMYEQLIADGLFPKNPKSIRTYYAVITGLATVTFNILLIISAGIFGRIMPRKTLQGVHASNVAKSLKNFLSSQERQLEFQADQQMMFEKLLPYAISFGVEKIWAQRFEGLSLSQPEWYQSSHVGAFTASSFSNSLNSSFASSLRSAATPTSSSSGFSSGFSGGSVGGGGGGGGGGSW